jgi:hypothetical protein
MKKVFFLNYPRDFSVVKAATTFEDEARGYRLSTLRWFENPRAFNRKLAIPRSVLYAFLSNNLSTTESLRTQLQGNPNTKGGDA